MSMTNKQLSAIPDVEGSHCSLGRKLRWNLFGLLRLRTVGDQPAFRSSMATAAEFVRQPVTVTATLARRLQAGSRNTAFLMQMLCLPCLALAEGRYVSSTSTNPITPYSTWATAAATIQAAVGVAQTGDTIFVAAGRYTAGVSLTMKTNINLLGAGRDVCVIDAGGTGHVVVFNLASGSLRGFTITGSGGGYYAGVFTSQAKVVVAENTIIRNKGGVVVSSSSEATIEGNLVCSNSGFGTIEVSRSSAEIRNNIVARNDWYGIYVTGGAAQIVNNTVSDCRTGIMLSPSRHSSVVNNLVVRNQDLGIDVVGGLKSALPLVALHHNDFWNNPGGNYWQEYGTIPGPMYSAPFTPLPEAGELSGDPMFANASQNDYRLRISSPCIDAGTNFDWMVTARDEEGQPRIFNCSVDRGADEAVLRCTGMQVADGICQTQWETALSAVCQLHYSTNLAGSNWLPVAGSTVTSTVPTVWLTDTNCSGSPRYYRASWLPK